MNNRPLLPPAGILNVAAILGFGTMIVIQIAGGMDNYPTVPPGLVISLAVVALIIVAARWWWTAILGAVWPLFLTVGAIASTIRADKSRFDNNFVLSTTIIQLAFLAFALATGLVFAAQRLRDRPRRVIG